MKPAGTGWEPWTAARAPEAELWVNEQRREILIVEDGAKRRMGAADAASFALEVAELERYYDATPMAPGARDAIAMLTRPGRSTAPSVVVGFAVLAVSLMAAALLLVVGNILRVPKDRRDAPFARALGTPSAARDTGPDSTVGRAAWSEWAAQHGSLQLRDAIQAQVRTDRLYERDIARAITPELDGTTRCPTNPIYDLKPQIEYDAVRSTYVRARAMAAEATGLLPSGASIRVKPPMTCWLPGEWAGVCIPVELIRGEYSVATCYRIIDTGVAQ